MIKIELLAPQAPPGHEPIPWTQEDKDNLLKVMQQIVEREKEHGNQALVQK